MNRSSFLTLLLLFGVATITFAQNYCPSTAYFCDDFYSHDFSAWAYSGDSPATPATGVTISSNIYHSGGDASMDVTLPVSGGEAQVSSGSTFSTSEIWYQFWFYIPSSFSMTDAFNIASIAGGEPILLRTSGGSYYIEDNNSHKGTHQLSTNSWHSIQIHNRNGSGNGVVQVYIDGALDINLSNLTFAGPITGVYLGANNSDSTDSGNLYFADVVVQGGSTQPTIGTSGFEVRYASTAARSALPVNVIMWGENTTDVLSATVDGSTVYTSSGSLPNNVTFSFDMTSLAKGQHTLAVTLQASAGTTRNSFSGTFQKYMDGTPSVYLDGNNSLHYKGLLFFPVSAFLDNTGPDTYANWGTAKGAINTMGWQGCFKSNFAYTPAQFQSCLDNTAVPYIGPDQNWEGRSSSLDAISASGASTTVGQYASLMTNDPYLLAWTWEDEPSGKVTLAQMQSVTDATHANDPNHPVTINNGGYPYDVIGDRQKGYYYPIVPFSQEVVADIDAFDMYPFIYSPNPTPPPSDWYVSELVSSFDACSKGYTYGLIPCMAFIEGGTCSVGGCNGNGPTAAQSTMEAWLAVIHGFKGIAWWGPSGWTTQSSAQWAALASFKTLVSAFQNTILSPATLTVTSNQTVPHSRVDATVRADTSTIYVFAARLSDVGESSDPTISATLTVSGSTYTGLASVAAEGGRSISVTSGAITDSFAPSAVHIYCFPKNSSTPLPPPPCPVTATLKVN